MCQLCKLKNIAERSRWPEPLVPHVNELKGLLCTAHTDATNLTVRKDLARKAAIANTIAAIDVKATSGLSDSGPTKDKALARKMTEEAKKDSVHDKNENQAPQYGGFVHMNDPWPALWAETLIPAEAEAVKTDAAKTHDKATDSTSQTLFVEVSTRRIEEIAAARKRLESTIELLTTSLQVIDSERSKWWKRPAKIKQRQQWMEQGDSATLARQQAVNMTCVGMLTDMEATIGKFVRWVVE